MTILMHILVALGWLTIGLLVGHPGLLILFVTISVVTLAAAWGVWRNHD